MRFKDFLILKEGRTKELTEEGFQKLLTTKCKKFNPDKNFLYRGLQGSSMHSGLFSGKYGVIDPVGKTRKSAYARGNHYTLLIDNLSNFKQYPKRSESIVCAMNDEDRAGAFSESGKAYRVIPFDDALVGICPENDIWDCFRLDELGMSDYDTLDNFNNMFNFFLEKMYNINGWKSGPFDKDGKTLMGAISKIDKLLSTWGQKELEDFIQGFSPDPKEKFLARAFCYDGVRKTLGKVFTTKGFSIKKGGGWASKSLGSVECWVGKSSCLMMKIDSGEKDYSHLKAMLRV